VCAILQGMIIIIHYMKFVPENVFGLKAIC